MLTQTASVETTTRTSSSAPRKTNRSRYDGNAADSAASPVSISTVTKKIGKTCASAAMVVASPEPLTSDPVASKTDPAKVAIKNIKATKKPINAPNQPRKRKVASPSVIDDC